MADRTPLRSPAQTVMVQRFENLALDDLDLNGDEEVDEDFLLCSDLDDDELNAIEEMTKPKRMKPNHKDVDDDTKKKSDSDVSAQVKSNPVASTPIKRDRGEVVKIKRDPPEDINSDSRSARNVSNAVSKKSRDLVRNARRVYQDLEKDFNYSAKDTNDSVELILEGLETVYMEERSRIIRKDGLISTPLHALKDLAEKYNEPIHSEVVYISDAASGKSTVRIEMMTGLFRGVGEAFYSRMASQMAALDLLMKVEESGGFKQILPFAIFPGWRIKARVMKDLEDICRRHRLKFPMFHLTSNIDHPELPKYKAVCSIGGHQISEGLSDLLFVAKKLAAYNAIEFITGVKCPLEFVALGEACTSQQELLKRGYKPQMSQAKKKWRQEVQEAMLSTSQPAQPKPESSEEESEIDDDDDGPELYLKDEKTKPMRGLKIRVSTSPKKRLLNRKVEFG